MLTTKWTLITIFTITSGIASATIAGAQGKPSTYVKWSDVSCTASARAECYAEVRCKLARLTHSSGLCSSRSAEVFDLQGYSRYHLDKEPTDFVVVTIHGLWATPEMWQDVLKHLNLNGELGRINLIELTLPGHPRRRDKSHNWIEPIPSTPLFASHNEWTEAITDTLKLARQLGRKTLVIGHSTGGLLAVQGALLHQELIDMLVLIEPALGVRSAVAAASCNLHRNSPEFLGPLLSSIGLPRSVYLNLGCEVDKLSKALFPEPSLSKSRAPRLKDKSPPAKLRFKRVASKIRTPTLMINNEFDTVVSPTANRSFTDGLSTNKSYVALIGPTFLPHFVSTQIYPKLIALETLQFSAENFPNSSLDRRYRQILEHLLVEMAYGFSPVEAALSSIGWSRTEFHDRTFERLIQRICFAIPRECTSATSAVHINRHYWMEFFGLESVNKKQRTLQLGSVYKPMNQNERMAQLEILRIADELRIQTQ